jgi:hypothetical protein
MSDEDHGENEPLLVAEFERRIDERASSRKLPKPEDRLKVLVRSCTPAEVVVDVTGKGFDR